MLDPAGASDGLGPWRWRLLALGAALAAAALALIVANLVAALAYAAPAGSSTAALSERITIATSGVAPLVILMTAVAGLAVVSPVRRADEAIGRQTRTVLLALALLGTAGVAGNALECWNILANTPSTTPAASVIAALASPLGGVILGAGVAGFAAAFYRDRQHGSTPPPEPAGTERGA
jgi:hypothetical protein